MKLEEKIFQISANMLRLSPGPLAELRRMEPGGAGRAAFWHLAGIGGFLEDELRTDYWMRIIQIMAILAPKGQRKSSDRLHDSKRSLGLVLCDGGDTGWQGDRPFFSEIRLMRFIAQPPEGRGESLQRVARMLCSNRDPSVGINCADVAGLLLFPEEKEFVQHLTRAYYRRLDSARRTNHPEETDI
jgi:CRISPR system Cascade subunit CasB